MFSMWRPEALSALAALLVICSYPAAACAQGQGGGFETPNSVSGTLADTAARQEQGTLDSYFAWKKNLEARTGLSFGIDTQVQYLSAKSDGDTTDAATNVFRFYGTWNLVGRNTPNDGALIFKVENRSALGDLIPTQALGPTLGYAGVFSSTYSDAGWVLTNLYWRQRLLNGRFSFVIGQVDTYDYVNVNSLASPWTAFTNLAFQQQPTYPGPGQGLGAAFQVRLNEQWAVLAGVANANGDASDPIGSAQKLFESGETFQHVAIGWFPDWKDRHDQSIQLTFWHADEKKEAGVKAGQGVSFLATGRFGSWRPFLRAGYADGAGTSLDRTVSIGTGYDVCDGKDLAGIALSWGRAPGNDRDQYTMEAFYRCGVTEFLQITPTLQYVINPANNPSTNGIWVLGGRASTFFRSINPKRDIHGQEDQVPKWLGKQVPQPQRSSRYAPSFIFNSDAVCERHSSPGERPRHPEWPGHGSRDVV